MKYKYSVDGFEFVEFKTKWTFKNHIAEVAARDHFDNCGEDWPIEMTIKTMDDKLVGKFKVELIYIPNFTAREI